MANDMRVQKVPITLDKERNLIVDLNTFVELEEEYGDHKTALAALESGSFKAVRKFLWASLVHEDPSLTEAEVGRLVGAANMEEIADVVLKSIEKVKKN